MSMTGGNKFGGDTTYGRNVQVIEPDQVTGEDPAPGPSIQVTSRVTGMLAPRGDRHPWDYPAKRDWTLSARVRRIEDNGAPIQFAPRGRLSVIYGSGGGELLFDMAVPIVGVNIPLVANFFEAKLTIEPVPGPGTVEAQIMAAPGRASVNTFAERVFYDGGSFEFVRVPDFATGVSGISQDTGGATATTQGLWQYVTETGITSGAAFAAVPLKSADVAGTSWPTGEAGAVAIPQAANGILLSPLGASGAHDLQWVMQT